MQAVGPTEPHRVRDTMPSRVWAAYQAVARLRAGHALGRRDDAPRPADRGEVAALHAGVRARGARARRRARSSRRSSPSRTTSGGSTTPTSRRAWPGRSSSSTRATSPRARAQRSAATSSTGSGSSPGCGGPSGRRGVACPASPSGARWGASSRASRALGPVRPGIRTASSAQPPTRDGRRSRHAGPTAAATSTAPRGCPPRRPRGGRCRSARGSHRRSPRRRAESARAAGRSRCRSAASLLRSTVSIASATAMRGG